MDPRRKEQIRPVSQIQKVPLFVAGSSDTAGDPCHQDGACFVLHYFTGFKFNPKDETKKNILYIPGGPGQIVAETHPNKALEFMSDGGIEHINTGKNNVVYFHVRGTGQSTIGQDSRFDSVLRARYVIRDIERLRKEVLGDKPWDAIYAHSWGTVVAQMYAEEYGKPDDRKVKHLILSAPITRTRTQMLDFRTRKASSNLESIYRFYRPDGECSCAEPTFLSQRVIDFERHKGEFDESDNLCFFSEHVPYIKRTVENIIDRIADDYGSVDFVVDNFDTLKNDQDFNAGGRFPYPKEFFAALRSLEMSGAPVGDNPLVFSGESKLLISAALLIANHLVATGPIMPGTPCEMNGAVSDSGDRSCVNTMCRRLKGVTAESFGSGGLESRRANYVFGVYDGVARWIFKMLKKECFTGDDLRNFADGESSPSDHKKFLRAQARRIGIVSDETVCGWDPAKHKHSVPTLLLKGTADAIVAGCQPEDFYNDGLTGPRVLLEFRGIGHKMSVTDAAASAGGVKEFEAFSDVVEQFVRTPLPQFRVGIADKLKILRAEEVQPGPDGRMDLNRCQAVSDM
jgi:pimeloyl-ACP methyl ester carboxylesterase